VSGQYFTNLSFESASFVPIAGDPYNSVQFSQAFPGWTATVGGVSVTRAPSNICFLDSSGVSIIDGSFINYDSPRGGVIQGRYTALLQAGFFLGGYGYTPADTSLFQTGLVPAGSQSLQFEALQAVGGGTAQIPFGVTLGGQALPLVALSTTANYTLYGANISHWAGQVEQLSFTVFAENPHVDDQYLFLDAIQFSAQSVPEPSILSLLGVCVLVCCWQKNRSKPVERTAGSPVSSRSACNSAIMDSRAAAHLGR
jgi:hypothetical protein